MTAWRTLGGWAAVHSVAVPVWILTGVALVSLLLATVGLPSLGVVQFISPVPLLLLFPAAAGVAAATATWNNARLPLPDPGRAVAFRTVWAVAWTLLAVGAVSLGQLNGAPVSWEAAARNVVLHTALGLLVVVVGQPHLVWLPPFAYMFVCMLFGQYAHESRYYWWAVILEEHTTAGQIVVVGTLFATALLAYVGGPYLLGRSSITRGRFTPRSPRPPRAAERC